MTGETVTRIARRRTGWCALVVALAALTAHLPALRGEFVWDDRIVQREHLPRLASLPDVLSPPEDIPGWPASFFRPVVLLSYLAERAVNDALWGPPRFPDASLEPRRARLPHLVTLLAHAAASAALVALAARCLGAGAGSSPGVWAGGLLFALHPVHSESAAFIPGRSDSLATLLLLLALLAALDGRDRGKPSRSLRSGALFLAALGAKEAALVGPLLLLLVFWLAPLRADSKGRTGQRFPAAPLLAWAAALGVYLALRSAGSVPLGGLALSDLGAAAGRSLAALAFCVRKTLFPWPVTPFVPALPGAAESFAVLGLGALATAAAVTALGRGRRLPIFCILWFLAACLPVLPVVVKNVAVASIAERYLYLPSVALALGAAGVIDALSPRARRAAAWPVGVLLLACGATCWNAALTWRNEETLFTTMTRRADMARHHYPWIALGSHYGNAGRFAEAAAAFRSALAAPLAPAGHFRALALGGLGDALRLQAGRVASAGDTAAARGMLDEAGLRYAEAAVVEPSRAEHRWARAAAILSRLALERGLGLPPDAAALQEAGREIAAARRLAPDEPEEATLTGLYRSLGGSHRE